MKLKISGNDMIILTCFKNHLLKKNLLKMREEVDYMTLTRMKTTSDEV